MDEEDIRRSHFKKHRIEYDFPYERMMKNEETRKVFQEYLKNSHCQEPILFLDEIHRFHLEMIRVHTTENVNNGLICDTFEILASEMIKKYLSSESPFQINLGGEERRALHERVNTIAKKCRRGEYTQFEMQQEQYKVFDVIENSLNCVLKQDTYPRFIRSKLWNEFVDSCCVKERFDIIERTCVYHDERFVSFTLDDFLKPMITEEDMTFAIQVCSDQSHWKPIENHFNKNRKRGDRIEVYQSKKRFIFSSKEQAKDLHNGDVKQRRLIDSLLRLKTPIKFTFYLPFYYEYVIGALQSDTLRKGNKDFSHKVIETSNIHSNSEKKLAFSTMLLEVSMPPPFVKREICFITAGYRTEIDGKEAGVFIVRPFNDSNIEKLNPDNQRCHMIQCWTFVHIHEYQTRVTMSLFMDFGGMLSMFSKQMYRQQINLTVKYRQNIMDTLSEMQKEGFGRPENTLGLLEVYEQNNTSRKQRDSVYSGQISKPGFFGQ